MRRRSAAAAMVRARGARTAPNATAARSEGGGYIIYIVTKVLIGVSPQGIKNGLAALFGWFEVVAKLLLATDPGKRRRGVPPVVLRMLMSAPPGEAVWRRGSQTARPELYQHPSMETIRASLRRPNSPSSPSARSTGCTPARSPPSRRSPSKQTPGTPASRSSLGSCCSTATGSRGQSPFAASSGSASSVSPSCHAAGFGLGSSRGATDYMPFALAPDTAFFKEVIRSERRAAACAQQRSFGRVASSQAHLLASGHVRVVNLATAFPASPARPIAGTMSPFASVAPPARPNFGSTGRSSPVFHRG